MAPEQLKSHEMWTAVETPTTQFRLPTNQELEHMGKIIGLIESSLDKIPSQIIDPLQGIQLPQLTVYVLNAGQVIVNQITPYYTVTSFSVGLFEEIPGDDEKPEVRLVKEVDDLDLIRDWGDHYKWEDYSDETFASIVKVVILDLLDDRYAITSADLKLARQYNLTTVGELHRKKTDMLKSFWIYF
ncbi:hypothetical protein HY408_01795 [Candidatus Gottesmanbacteria bacterium]|nr:hypothetical protein [Candidatus Gottesmanbacteria bacterium]